MPVPRPWCFSWGFVERIRGAFRVDRPDHWRPHEKQVDHGLSVLRVECHVLFSQRAAARRIREVAADGGGEKIVEFALLPRPGVSTWCRKLMLNRSVA
jgi:hypothetical protein